MEDKKFQMPIKKVPVVDFRYSPGDLMTRTEVAAYYKVTTQTVDNWVKSSILAKPSRIGGAVRWLFSDIELKTS